MMNHSPRLWKGSFLRPPITVSQLAAVKGQCSPIGATPAELGQRLLGYFN
jgi:hypothetical protein